MLSWKVLLVSAAVLFAALGLRVSLPVAATNLPLLWSFFLLCFKPPYLFVVLNAIIISIVASSRFHHSSNPQSPEPTPPRVESMPAPTVPEPPLFQVKAVLEVEKKVIEEDVVALKRKDSTEIPSPEEKPLVSARFTHRKFLKSSSEGNNY